ncbi:MAG: hypothetical protein ACFFED_01240 [Candidatus Thorarchaeota archaeon]
MTDTAPTIPLLEEPRKRFSKIKLKDVRKIQIFSSSHPHAIAASSILCRAILRANVLFHVKFIDNIVPVDYLEAHMGTTSSTLVLAIGLDIIGATSSHQKHLLGIGSRFHAKIEDLTESSSDIPVAAEAIEFAKETMGVLPEDLGLAAISMLLESPTNEITKAIIAASLKEGIIASRKGFKIPGFNFFLMDEVFSNNIHPYLDSLSGAPESCQRIFEDAEISYSRWSTPLNKLNPKETRQLNAVLLLSLSKAAVPYVLGSDYEFQYEKESSPLRHFSSISSMSQVIWSRHEMGLLLGVLIGDRARLLDSFVKTYRKYCQEAISIVAEVNALLDDSETTKFADTHILMRTSTLPDTTFPDVGRITLESNAAKDVKFLLLVSEKSLYVIWKKQLSLLAVSAELFKKKIQFISTSKQSVRISDTSDATCSKIVDIMKVLTKDVQKS